MFVFFPDLAYLDLQLLGGLFFHIWEDEFWWEISFRGVKTVLKPPPARRCCIFPWPGEDISPTTFWDDSQWRTAQDMKELMPDVHKTFHHFTGDEGWLRGCGGSICKDHPKRVGPVFFFGLPPPEHSKALFWTFLNTEIGIVGWICLPQFWTLSFILNTKFGWVLVGSVCLFRSQHSQGNDVRVSDFRHRLLGSRKVTITCVCVSEAKGTWKNASWKDPKRWTYVFNSLSLFDREKWICYSLKT